jgi:hypothetical protein
LVVTVKGTIWKDNAGTAENSLLIEITKFTRENIFYLHDNTVQQHVTNITFLINFYTTDVKRLVRIHMKNGKQS